MGYTGNVLLTVQSVSNTDNSIIFNRIVSGLQNGNILSTGIDTTAVLSGGFTLPVPVTMVGIYIKNLDPSAVITVTDANSGFEGNITLNSNGVFLIFNPVTPIGLQPVVTSSIPGSLIEYCYWSYNSNGGPG